MAVVALRGYSRTSGETCDERVTSSPVRSCRMRAARSSCSGLRNENRNATAIASAPDARIRSATAATSASSSARTTSPAGPMRSRTSNRRSRGTSGGGFGARRSYRCARSWVPISSVSRKPSVVTRATRAVRACTIALVAIVVPCAR